MASDAAGTRACRPLVLSPAAPFPSTATPVAVHFLATHTWLSWDSAGPRLHARPGAVDTTEVLSLVPVHAATRRFHLRCNNGRSVCCVLADGSIVLAPASSTDEDDPTSPPAVFTASASPAGSVLLLDRGTALGVQPDGAVAAATAHGSTSVGVQLVLHPLLGLTSPQHVLQHRHGHKVALWGVEEGVQWVTLCPPNLWGGGGDVKCGTQRLLVWEQHPLHVLDARAGKVAIESSFRRFVTSTQDGTLSTHAVMHGEWETFTLEAAGLAVALRNNHAPVGYVYCEADGSMHCHARCVTDRALFWLLDADVCSRAYWNASPTVSAPASQDAATAEANGGGVIGLLGSLLHTAAVTLGVNSEDAASEDGHAHAASGAAAAAAGRPADHPRVQPSTSEDGGVGDPPRD